MKIPDSKLSLEAYAYEVDRVLADPSLSYNQVLLWGEVATSRANWENDHITWTLIALKIYTHLESRKSSLLNMNTAYIRLNLIVRGFGMNDPRSKPYIDELLNWIAEPFSTLNKLNIQAEAVSWKSLPEENKIEKLRFLRAVKMRLKIAAELQENGLSLEDSLADLIPFSKLLP